MRLCGRKAGFRLALNRRFLTKISEVYTTSSRGRSTPQGGAGRTRLDAGYPRLDTAKRRCPRALHRAYLCLLQVRWTHTGAKPA
jgi:hypothetical protein